MKVRTTEPTFVGGEPVKAGKILTVGEADGRNLIAGGKAVPIDETDEAAPADRALGASEGSTR